MAAAVFDLGEGAPHLVAGDAAHAFSADAGSVKAGWRLAQGALDIRADRLGVAPLYIARRGARLALASSALEAAKLLGDARLDEAAMAVFLRLGFMVGEDTPFEDVRSLRPGAMLRFDAQGETGAPGGYEAPAPITIGHEDAADQFAALFSKAVKARLPAPGETLCVPLSGGRDSRHIAYRLCALGRKPDVALTMRAMPPQRDEDIRIAALIAGRLDIAHKTAEIDFKEFIARQHEKNRAFDFMTDEHHWFMALLEAMQGANMVMDGLAGDALGNGLFYRPELSALMRAGALEDAAESLLGAESALSWLAAPLRKRFSRERARARLAEALAPHAHAPDPGKEFFFWSRTRREIALAPFTLFSKHMQVTTPYLDADLMAFLRALPLEDHGAPGLHDAAIMRAFPDMRDIGFEKKGAGGGFSRAESRAMARGALGFWRAQGLGRGVSKRLVAPRFMRLALGESADAHFWWLMRYVYMRGLEAALKDINGAL